MGIFASHEPRMKKQVMANQEMVKTMAQCFGPATNFSVLSESPEGEVGREICVDEAFGDPS